MSIVAREDIDNLNTLITVTIEKADYTPKFERELSKQRDKAHMKGFRKGKTPVSVLKKMYGKPILADVINELLQEKLFEYLDEHKIQYLGQPLASEDQKSVDFNLQDLQDFEFVFELGLTPQFELNGLSKESIFKLQDVIIEDEVVQEEIDSARKQYGERVSAEDNIEEEDMLTFTAKEMAGDAPKEGGIETTFKILVSNIADPATKETIMGIRVGDTLVVNIYELEEDKDADFVNRYLLNLEAGQEGPESPMFEISLADIVSVVPAEMDQAFFDKVFGEGQVSSEEEAKEKIRSEIASHYTKQAEALLFRDFQNFLMEANTLSLPDAFLKKWLLSSNEELNEDQLEREYPYFAKNLHWTLIRNKLADMFGIRVTRQEIVDQYKNRIRAYLGNMSSINDDMLNDIAQSVMKDEKEVEKISDEIFSDKLFDLIREHVSVEMAPVSIDEFREIS
ncbi:MAG: trigger factor, partial [Saprospiraceae bacterium]|nr:trigger factor [Saprospiraceae bacterium]